MVLSLAANGAANAQGPLGSPQFGVRGQAPESARLPASEAGQERARRAAKQATNARGSMRDVRMAHAGEPSAGAERLSQDGLPVAQRSALPVRTHGTDPDLPRQATARSAPRDLRAPAGLAGPNGEVSTRAAKESMEQRAPRMSVQANTRATRATFEDWLFGR